MTLLDVLNQISANGQGSAQLTDLRIGTVETVNPLSITINTNMAPIQSQLLYLTENVVEKKIPVVAHSHQITVTDTFTGGGSATCSTALSNIACTENGSTLPVENGYIILNRALKVGDKVLMLRVQHGQKYIVLSRVFQEV